MNALFPIVASSLNSFSFQVMGSKTKIFIVLEFVTGGELFDKIVSSNLISNPILVQRFLLFKTVFSLLIPI